MALFLLLFIFFFIFACKDCSRGNFSRAFNSSSLHQIWQNLHENYGLKFDYPPVWSFLTNWHHNSHRTGSNKPTQIALNYQIWQFMITTLSQWLRSFGAESRAMIWHQKRQNVPLPSPIYSGGFHELSIKKSKAKVVENHYLLCQNYSFSLSATISTSITA